MIGRTSPEAAAAKRFSVIYSITTLQPAVQLPCYGFRIVTRPISAPFPAKQFKSTVQ
jgi:hypothetical protein